jgi:hypothetical protein
MRINRRERSISSPGRARDSIETEKNNGKCENGQLVGCP